MTQFKRDLKLMSAPPALRYMVDCVRSTRPTGFLWSETGRATVFYATLYEDFQKWQHVVGDDREKISQTQFARSLSLIGLQTKNVTIHGVQKKGFTFNREEIITSLRKYLKDDTFDLDLTNEQPE